MSTIEDRLHAAARGVAATVTADSVPPLDLCRVPSRPDRKTPRRRLGFAVLTPLAAAVAVVAVIVTSVVLASGPHSPSPAAARVILGSVPRYYMAVLPTAPGSADAVIRDTLTGAALATIRPPAPFTTFDTATGTADDRTFVLSASVGQWLTPAEPTKLFLARFDPATDAVNLTALPVPEIPKTEILMGTALSPSGTKLAVSLQTGKDIDIARVSVYSLTTGAARSWQSPGKASFGDVVYDSMSVSWSQTGALAFNWVAANHGPGLPRADGVWLLNTASGGGNLLAHSRQVVRAPSTGLQFAWDGVLTPDGTKVVVPVWRSVSEHRNTGTRAIGFAEYSAVTGQLIHTLDKTDINVGGSNSPIWTSSLVWTSPSGSVLVVGAPTGRRRKIVLGVLSGRRFIPIPGAPAVPIDGPPHVAF